MIINFTEEEKEEIKYLWINKCLTIKEIAEWFGVSTGTIKRNVKKIKIDSSEFQEKSAGFTDFLKEHPHSKIAEKMIKERRKRLKEAYDRTRYFEQNHKW